MEGLQDYTLHAAVDPRWIAQSLALGHIHPRDVEQFPTEEAVYLAHALAPRKWLEQAQVYGKWVWGCVPREPFLEEHRIAMHRGLRKSHQGWPYSWIAYARTGDGRLLQMADVGTRYQTDIAFIHYTDEKLNHRPRGWYTRFHIPWADNRPYPQVRTRESKTDYLWHAYYMTGYVRALDVALDFKDLIKYSGSGLASPHDDQTLFERVGGDENRSSVEVLQTCINMYEATFDPWFMAAAHQIARVQLQAARSPQGWQGHFEGTGIRDWNAFHGSDEYRELVAVPYAKYWGSHHTPADNAWALVTPMMEPRSLAYELSGDASDAGVIRGAVDDMILSTYMAAGPDYCHGFRAPPGTTNEWGPTYTGYLLRDLPAALALLDHARAAGQVVQSQPNAFLQSPATEQHDDQTQRSTMRWTVHFLKQDGKPLPLTIRMHGAAKWAKDEASRARVTGPQGRIWLQQEVAGRGLKDQVLPAEAPAGLYTLEVEIDTNVRLGSSHPYRPSLRLPVTPAGTPEVYAAARGEDGKVLVGPSHHTAQYWLPRPGSLPGAEAWRVEFLPYGLLGLDVLTLGSSDKAILMQRHEQRTQASLKKPTLLEAPLADLGQARFLSISRAGVSGGFMMDAEFSAYLAVSPQRWFDPGK